MTDEMKNDPMPETPDQGEQQPAPAPEQPAA
jgi:hypothetical protein